MQRNTLHFSPWFSANFFQTPQDSQETDVELDFALPPKSTHSIVSFLRDDPMQLELHNEDYFKTLVNIILGLDTTRDLDAAIDSYIESSEESSSKPFSRDIKYASHMIAFERLIQNCQDWCFEAFLRSRTGAIFRHKVFALIEQIFNWGKKHARLDEAKALNNVLKLKEHFEYKGENSDYNDSVLPLFTDGVILLKRICSQLDNPNIPLDLRIKAASNLLHDVGVCRPGALTHITETHLFLLRDINAELAMIRRSIAYQTANEILCKHAVAWDIYPGNEVHHINYIINMYADRLGVATIEDAWAQPISKQQKFDAAFEHQITKSLTPDAVIDQILNSSSLWHDLYRKQLNELTASEYDSCQKWLDSYGQDTTFSLKELGYDEETEEFKWPSNLRDYFRITLYVRLAQSSIFNLTVAGAQTRIYLPDENNFDLSFVYQHGKYHPLIPLCLDSYHSNDISTISQVLTSLGAFATKTKHSLLMNLVRKLDRQRDFNLAAFFANLLAHADMQADMHDLLVENYVLYFGMMPEDGTETFVAAICRHLPSFFQKRALYLLHHLAIGDVAEARIHKMLDALAATNTLSAIRYNIADFIPQYISLPESIALKLITLLKQQNLIDFPRIKIQFEAALSVLDIRNLKNIKHHALYLIEFLLNTNVSHFFSLLKHFPDARLFFISTMKRSTLTSILLKMTNEERLGLIKLYNPSEIISAMTVITAACPEFVNASNVFHLIKRCHPESRIDLLKTMPTRCIEMFFADPNTRAARLTATLKLFSPTNHVIAYLEHLCQINPNLLHGLTYRALNRVIKKDVRAGLLGTLAITNFISIFSSEYKKTLTHEDILAIMLSGEYLSANIIKNMNFQSIIQLASLVTAHHANAIAYRWDEYAKESDFHLVDSLRMLHLQLFFCLLIFKEFIEIMEPKLLHTFWHQIFPSLDVLLNFFNKHDRLIEPQAMIDAFSNMPLSHLKLLFPQLNTKDMLTAIDQLSPSSDIRLGLLYAVLRIYKLESATFAAKSVAHAGLFGDHRASSQRFMIIQQVEECISLRQPTQPSMMINEQTCLNDMNLDAIIDYLNRHVAPESHLQFGQIP